MNIFRGLMEDESGQWRTDYTALALGMIVVLIFVLALIGVDFTNVNRWVRRLERAILGR